MKNKLWLWCHEAGSYNGQYNLPRHSRMTPAEAACYMGVSNVLFITYGNRPEPPFDQHLLALSPLDRVVWSIVGDSSSPRADLDEVLALAPRFPNLAGAIMDDFFHAPDASGAVSRVSAAELQRYRARLQAAARPLDLYVVVYAHDLGLPLQPHLEPCDAVTFWTWTSDKLAELEQNFARLEAIAPGKRKLLGCYMWDFGAGRPMPLERMQYQCRVGQDWLRQSRIEGMILLSSPICDLGLETVEWAREWIKSL
jgi:hypothetical protein